MVKVAEDHSIARLIESGETLNRYLTCRNPPIEKNDMRAKLHEFAELIERDPKKFNLPEKVPDESNETAYKFYLETKKHKVEMLARQRIYTWQAVDYNEYQSLLYLFGRAPQEFAAIMRIFKEIQKRDPNFQPRSYFDFGSGVGTGLWAATELWKDSIYEYYLVDSSASMNDLSDKILRDGDVNKAMWLRNVNFRQFFPARQISFDIVLSAYTMFEQENVHRRIEHAQNLWNKTENYLIFIENGTNSGFTILNEIRKYLTKVIEANGEKAFIFSPCPHESECPRYSLQDKTPCNFEVRYNSLPFSGVIRPQRHLYSYLVFKKGEPNDTSDRWPRVVRPTLMKPRHTICKFCVNDGNLKTAIFTKGKHEKFTYRCSKHINWGDQFPSNHLNLRQKTKEDEKILEEARESD